MALRSAQLLNRADLARDVGISGSTAGAWLSALTASHQLMLLEPWFSNRTASLVKRPKVHLRDAGLAAFLCGVYDVDALRSSPLVGALWETLVCSEIRRAQINQHGGWDLNFWADRSKDADFVLHRGGRFHLGDAKWTQYPAPATPPPCGKIAATLPSDSVASMAIFCATPNAYPVVLGIKALPLEAVAASEFSR